MSIIRHAPAKINLTLEILGRREDGFHEIRSVMQAISLFDTLTFAPAPTGQVKLLGGTADAPPDTGNLVYRAALALREAARVDKGVEITLHKFIPVGAGLGGGSSDAATTLMALNSLWQCGFTTDGLAEIGAMLGSDIPFFLTGGTSLVTGRGEILAALPSPDTLWVVLARPDSPLPTAAVYRAYAAAGIPPSPENATEQMMDVLANDEFTETRIDLVANAMRNDLQSIAFGLCPEAQTVEQRLQGLGARGTLLSGSGSAVFGLCENETDARRIAEALKGQGLWSTAAKTIQLGQENTR